MVRDALQRTRRGPAEPDPIPPPDRIVTAAIVCLERDGLDATGIREIAREASVNSAAINYYFRSKENLIRLALERTLENAFGEIISELDQRLAEGEPLHDALFAVIDDYARHARDFPRLAYAHLRDALVNQRYDGRAIERLNEFLVELLQRLAPEADDEQARALRVALVQLWSNFIVCGALPGLFDPFLRLDFSDEQFRTDYVNRLLAPVLGLLE